ncbi:MAG: beta-propeller domain-containing protein [Pseudonocardiales bacterium]
MTHLPRRDFWVAAQRVALVAAAVVVVIAIATPDSSAPGRTAVPTAPAHPASMGLVAYSSCADLLSGLRAHTAANVGPWGLLGSVGSLGPQYAVPAVAPGPARDSATGEQASAAHSTTNVHEAGVDEPDIVKSDGDRIVTASGGWLRVIDTASRKVTGNLQLPGAVNRQPADLLVSGDRALVVLHPSFDVQYAVPEAAGPTPRPGINSPPSITSTYLLIDLSGQPRVLDSITANGSYVDARMVGSTVRLVVRSGPVIRFPTDSQDNLSNAQRIARNQAIVRRAPLSAWLPTYDTASGEARTVPCGQISHPIDYTGTSMLTIYTVNLARGFTDVSPVTLAADGDTVYATQSSLYIASNPMWWGCCFADDVISSGPVLRSTPLPKPPAEKTGIHRFDITGSGAPHYLGSGSVPGRLLSQYSLSDYEGYLRVATTTSNTNTTAGGGPVGGGPVGSRPSGSSVYVLADKTLKVTGYVAGLGRGEQIYAVRFVGPLGYVVTFRQTDPLYVIDLHNPAAPRQAGELTLTGYSSYLHPAGDGRLIGVGQEANSQGRVAGLQVSLFDVSNSSAPKRLAQVVRTDAPGEGQLDPHAFLYWPATGIVVVPIQSWAGSSTGKVLVLRASGNGLATVGLISHPAGQPTGSDGQTGIQRSMVIGDSIWTLSSAGVKVSTMSTLADQAWIPLG